MLARNGLLPLLNRLMGRAALTEADQAAVLSLPLTLSHLSARKVYIREGEKPTHCCLVLSGFSIRHKIVVNGGRQIVGIHMRGDMVDLQHSFLETADHNVETLTKSELAFIPRDAFQEIVLARPQVAKAMFREALVEGSILREWIASMGRRDARQRIAHLLCEFAIRLDQAGLGEVCNYELPMTQDQIADTLGLTGVHVNRTLMALDAEGLTKRTMRSVIIEDFEKLAKLGDFDPLYLHLPEGQTSYMHAA